MIRVQYMYIRRYRKRVHVCTNGLHCMDMTQNTCYMQSHIHLLGITTTCTARQCPPTTPPDMPASRNSTPLSWSYGGTNFTAVLRHLPYYVVAQLICHMYVKILTIESEGLPRGGSPSFLLPPLSTMHQAGLTGGWLAIGRLFVGMS